jgi:hypothetical protein
MRILVIGPAAVSTRSCGKLSQARVYAVPARIPGTVRRGILAEAKKQRALIA